MSSLLRTMKRGIKRTKRNGIVRDGYLTYRARERSANRQVMNKRDWIAKEARK